MTLGIRPALRHCLIGDRPVFLDLATERYKMLGTSLERDFLDYLGGRASEASIARLQARSILVEGPSSDPAKPAPVAPVFSLYEAAVGRPSLPLVAETLARQYRIRRRLRSGALQSLLAGLRSHKADAHEPDSRHSAMAAALIAAERIAGRPDDCLAVGIATAQMLGCRGVAFDFVIGVTLPFSAHCWVQCGPVVLIDSVERIEAFTPILSL